MPKSKVRPDVDIVIEFKDPISMKLLEVLKDRTSAGEFIEGYTLVVPSGRANLAWRAWVRSIKTVGLMLKRPTNWINSLYHSLHEEQWRNKLNIESPSPDDTPFEKERKIVSNKFKLEILGLLTYVSMVHEYNADTPIDELIDNLLNPDPRIFGEYLLNSGILTQPEVQYLIEAYLKEKEAEEEIRRRAGYDNDTNSADEEVDNDEE